MGEGERSKRTPLNLFIGEAPRAPPSESRSGAPHRVCWPIAFSVTEAAAALGVHRRIIYQMIAGGVPLYRFGTRRKVLVTDLIAPCRISFRAKGVPSMTLPNYAGEGQIREACAAAGVRIECLEDVITRFRPANSRKRSLTASLPNGGPRPITIFSAGRRPILTRKPSLHSARERTLKAQGEFVREHGEAKAAEVAALFATKLGGKPGKTPDTFKPKKPNDPNAGLPKGTTNPFSKDGWSLAKQGSLLKAVGPEKSAQIAAAVGAKIGDTRPNPKF